MHKWRGILHFIFGLLLLLFLALGWLALVTAGRGDWHDLSRYASVGGMIVAEMAPLLVFTVLLLPAGILNLVRGVQCFSWNPATLYGFHGLRGWTRLANLQVIVLLVVHGMTEVNWSNIRETNWLAVLRGQEGRPARALPGADKLEFPELPLKPESPYDLALRKLDGTETTLETFKGKAIFLNIWATWCGPCRAEMPAIQKLYEQVRGNEQIAVVLVSNEEPADVESFLKENTYDLPIYTTKEFPGIIDPGGFPTTYLIAPDGTIALRHTGTLQWDDPKVVSFLEELTKQQGWQGVEEQVL